MPPFYELSMNRIEIDTLYRATTPKKPATYNLIKIVEPKSNMDDFYELTCMRWMEYLMDSKPNEQNITFELFR